MALIVSGMDAAQPGLGESLWGVFLAVFWLADILFFLSVGEK